MVSGKLGGGKSLATVGKMRDYLNQGRAIATNLDLNLEKLINPWAKNVRAIRLPDKPTVDDLENLPEPYQGDYSEEKSGLIVLDECGTWFNTREYRDKSRQPLINKLLHIRKAGWDVMFIIQHPEMIDKQVREGIGEHVVSCQRADRLGIPFVTGIGKLFGVNIRPPKIHLAIVKYGTSSLSPVVDRWVYNGADLYDAYDTRQVFGANDCGLNSLLPPYTIYGQYYSRKQHAKDQYQKTKKTFKSFLQSAKRTFFLLGVAAGYAITALASDDPETKPHETTTNSKKQEEEAPTPVLHELDHIRITALVKQRHSFEYYFWDELNQDSFNPASLGYKVRLISDCKASLIKMNERYDITCKAVATSAELGEREVRRSDSAI